MTPSDIDTAESGIPATSVLCESHCQISPSVSLLYYADTALYTPVQICVLTNNKMCSVVQDIAIVNTLASLHAAQPLHMRSQSRFRVYNGIP